MRALRRLGGTVGGTKDGTLKSAVLLAITESVHGPILRQCYLDHSLSHLGGALESPIAASAGDKDEPSDAIPIVRS
jgi:hypothetical protein